MRDVIAPRPGEAGGVRDHAPADRPDRRAANGLDYDGANKWMGYLPKRHFLYNVGWYTDVLSQGHSFSSYDQQFVARVGWLPVLEDDGTLLHVALAGRYGLVNDRTLRLRSRPELNVAPCFVDTDPFAAHDTRLAQAGGYFLAVSPKRPVLSGGPGAWEAVLRLSYVDLEDGPIHGGRFWRLTPMVNWCPTDHLRLELACGVGQLDRFGLLGTTQFLQTRLQFQF